MSHSKPVIPQNDNVAHALAGAGGGVLSMALTYAPPSPHSCLAMRVPRSTPR